MEREYSYFPKITGTREGKLYITIKDFFSSLWFKDELERINNSEGSKFIKKQIEEMVLNK